MTDPFRHDDGAYVLGALSPDERREFEAHLETCPQCAARVAEVADLPGLLAGIDPSEVLADLPALPDTLLPRLVREVRHERTRTRWYAVAGAAAAAAVAAVITAVVVTTSGGSSGGSSGPALAMRPLVTAPVRATVALTAETWGTRITLRCRYAEDGGPALRYDMEAFGRGGTSFALGGWRIAGGQDVTYVSGVPVPPSAITRIDVTTAGGLPILRTVR